MRQGGPLTGGSRFPMSILRKVNVALSNLRNAHVTLSILRNAHVPCHFLLKARRMSLSPKKAHVAVSILGVKGHTGGQKLVVTCDIAYS